MKKFAVITLVILSAAISGTAQKLASPVVGKYVVPDNLLIQIVKAEDARDHEPVVAMLTNVNTATRYRTASPPGGSATTARSRL